MAKLDKLTVQRFHNGKMAKQDKTVQRFHNGRGDCKSKEAAKRDKLAVQQFHSELGVRVTVGEIKELAKRDAPRRSNTTDTAIWTITPDG